MSVHAGKYGLVNLELSRIENALWQILREFRRDFELTPIEEIQDLRAFSILWAAVFLPETVSRHFLYTLSRMGEQCRERPDYGNNCWYRVMPIEAALYVLTGRDFWLPVLLNNVNHHKSSLRTMTIESLALIAHRLEFNAETLRRIGHNLEVAHFFCEWPVIFFAISRGSADYKRRTIEQWLDSSYKMNPDEREVVEKLAKGGMVANPFLHRLLRTQQYLLLQIVRNPPEQPPQPALDDDWGPETEILASDQMTLFADQTADLCQVVWERLSAHPLTASFIQAGNNL